MYYRRAYKLPQYRRRYRKGRKLYRGHKKTIPYYSKLNSGTVYRFKRQVHLTGLTSANPGNSFYAYDFALEDLPNYADFTNLYDRYCITGVKLMFYPRTTENNVAGASTGELIYAIDYNDVTVPTDEEDLLQYQGVRVKRVSGDSPFGIFVKCRPVNEVYQSAITTGYSTSAARQWISSANTSVPHYGIKIAWANSTSNLYVIDVYATYYIRCKTVN